MGDVQNLYKIQNGGHEEREIYCLALVYLIFNMDMTSNVVANEISEFGSILMDGSDHFGVSTVLFDSHEELIWVGNEGVRCVSCKRFEIQYLFY